MAEHNNSSPQDESAVDAAAALTAGNGVPNPQSGVSASAVDNSRKRPRPSNGDDEDDDEDSKPGRERRKIEIKFIQDKSRRHITFSKRKAGIMKKVPLSWSDLDRSTGCRACTQCTDACFRL
jgi:pheromone receptor transcription factor